MKEFRLRDLETGEIIVRHGGNAHEILQRQPDKYVEAGKEPPGWGVGPKAEAPAKPRAPVSGKTKHKAPKRGNAKGVRAEETEGGDELADDEGDE